MHLEVMFANNYGLRAITIGYGSEYGLLESAVLNAKSTICTTPIIGNYDDVKGYQTTQDVINMAIQVSRLPKGPSKEELTEEKPKQAEKDNSNISM